MTHTHTDMYLHINILYMSTGRSTISLIILSISIYLGGLGIIEMNDTHTHTDMYLHINILYMSTGRSTISLIILSISIYLGGLVVIEMNEQIAR